MSTATDFQDLIDALETNLQLMGVDDAEFDRSTGILGLVDRITDIEPSTNIDLDITCTLSSSENSIDYGESIVLTATLLASYDDTSTNNVDLKTGEITGATIQFKQGNTVIGTGITNNNGVATLTYTPTTTGTLNITANFNGTINFNRATSTGINVLVNETLTLTSDKTILSAADNESATLTATLHAANNSGQTVTFEVRKASDDSLVETLTGVTDSSGKATVSYLGKGVGDIYIKAICRLLIQTYSIEDCRKYVPTEILNSGRDIGYEIFQFEEMPDWIVECDFKASQNYNQRFMVTSSSNVALGMGFSYGAHCLCDYPYNISSQVNNEPATANTYYHFFIEKHTDSYKIGHDDHTHINQAYNYPTASTQTVGIWIGQNGSITLKNLKVKPL